jgi:hypothetical protein
MTKKNVLVFPCGSEIALEIYRSLKHSTHVNLIGAGSVNDHGEFVFENYISGVPFANTAEFISHMAKLVKEHNITAIYPSLDSVISILKNKESELGCTVISSSAETTNICLSKKSTYNLFDGKIPVPKIYSNTEEVLEYPIFIKPDIGYGSRGVLKANNKEEADNHIKKNLNSLLLEFLPGREFTVDCFSDFKGKLRFVGPRERNRISNGISVNTSTMPLEDRFNHLAEIINEEIKPNGAWFFQVKENSKGKLVLMEIASRLGGSSAVYRAKGINFANLSIFNALGFNVEILENSFDVEMDRALDNIFRVHLSFNHVYVDFDDTILLGEKVNGELVGVLYNYINQGKKIHLITKHKKNINDTLKEFRLEGLFESIIHLTAGDQKFKFMNHKDAIFIDDSFAERKEVLENSGIPVFGLDVIKLKF